MPKDLDSIERKLEVLKSYVSKPTPYTHAMVLNFGETDTNPEAIARKINQMYGRQRAIQRAQVRVGTTLPLL